MPHLTGRTLAPVAAPVVAFVLALPLAGGDEAPAALPATTASVQLHVVAPLPSFLTPPRTPRAVPVKRSVARHAKPQREKKRAVRKKRHPHTAQVVATWTPTPTPTPVATPRPAAPLPVAPSTRPAATPKPKPPGKKYSSSGSYVSEG